MHNTMSHCAEHRTDTGAHTDDASMIAATTASFSARAVPKSASADAVRADDDGEYDEDVVDCDELGECGSLGNGSVDWLVAAELAASDSAVRPSASCDGIVGLRAAAADR